MKIKTITLTIALIGISTLLFGQKNKKIEITIDSLYTKDIQELKVLYPDLKVNEMELIPNRVLLPQENDSIATINISVKYPQIAKENGIQGTVYCRFIIDTLGQMKEIKIIKGLEGGCSQEVLRVLNELAKKQNSQTNLSKNEVVIYQKLHFDFVLR